MIGLRKIRKKKELTQQKLADISCVHRVNISQFEIGSQTPSVPTAKKLASALGCTLDELLADDEADGGDPDDDRDRGHAG